MSEPTYLIRVEHEPGEEMLPWTARVTRISDLAHCVTRWGTTEKEAVEAAQKWIRAAFGKREPERELYAAEDGTLMVGESVRVLRPT